MSGLWGAFKNKTIDILFRDEDGNIDPELVKAQIPQEAQNEIEKSIRDFVSKKYGGMVVVIGTTVFASGILVGYLVFRPSTRRAITKKKR